MKAKELRKKNPVELSKDLKEAQQKLRELRFKIALKQIKNHRELWSLKKQIAQILTIFKERELLKKLGVEEKQKQIVSVKTNDTKK